MSKFKVGDKVVLRKDNKWYGCGGQIPEGCYATITSITTEDDRDFYLCYMYTVKWFGGGNKYRNEDLELYQEEKKQMLKQDWSIKVENKEQAEAYKQTLLVLGYPLTIHKGEQDYYDGYTIKIAHGKSGDKEYFWMSRYATTANQFDSISDFLIWHFTPEETEEQKQIRELEETILKAQQQIQQLKEKI